ncbi:heterokaryon incompatibility protein-domain-containing protein [Microdochium bolleyi]|uniref:Heterokaryon incompatibility protein-domain-containing protein n=1 Tax=Microdochium bolleyi TaxID=196109 RepID=A0A136IL35_9PEZI|nr:heterokaryon incompatibility protein-domain-containing protein [Microdochium bolleyi]
MPLSYTELDPARAQIRLLRLKATSKTTARSKNYTEPCLSYSLERTSLDSKPNFAALSYVWGDPEDTVGILVDGTTVQITRNLYDVLQWHRGWRPDWAVWADAVCINQDDPREKGHQIRQMGRVYREATKVICWIGPTTDRIELWLRWGPRLGEPFSVRGLRRISGWLRREAWWMIFRAMAWLGGDAELAVILIALMIRNGGIDLHYCAYFHRMWTFQESFLPHKDNIICMVGGVAHGPWLLHGYFVDSFPSFISQKCDHLEKAKNGMSNLEMQQRAA